MIELVAELEKLTPTDHVKKVIDTAKAGQFHDYRSRSVCGKMYAVECFDWLIKTPGLVTEDWVKIKNMRQHIIDGEYDEDLTDDDKKFLLAETEADDTISATDKEFFINAMGLRNVNG